MPYHPKQQSSQNLIEIKGLDTNLGCCKLHLTHNTWATRGDKLKKSKPLQIINPYPGAVCAVLIAVQNLYVNNAKSTIFSGEHCLKEKQSQQKGCKRGLGRTGWQQRVRVKGHTNTTLSAADFCTYLTPSLLSFCT